MKKIGFLSFGHWTSSLQSRTRSAADTLLQSIELSVAAEELGADGAYFRVHHFARQLASPFPLMAAIEGCHRAFDCGSLHAALDRLMVHPHGMPYRKKRQAFPVGQQYPRPLHPDRRFRARAADLLPTPLLPANSIGRRHPAMTFYPCCRINRQLTWHGEKLNPRASRV